MIIQNPTVDSAEARAVRFHTAVPDALFRAVLSADHGVDSLTELSALTGWLDLNGSELANIDGIEYAAESITTLYTYDNNIQSCDLSEFADMQYLNVSGNGSSSIGTLSLMTSAILLNLSNNALQRFGSVADMTALTVVRINSNLIDQEELESIVDDLWTNRAVLGAASCVITLSHNTGSEAVATSRATEIADLISAGCSVTNLW